MNCFCSRCGREVAAETVDWMGYAPTYCGEGHVDVVTKKSRNFLDKSCLMIFLGLLSQKSHSYIDLVALPQSHRFQEDLRKFAPSKSPQYTRIQTHFTEISSEKFNK